MATASQPRGRSLQTRVLLAISATTAALIVALTVPVRALVTDSFAQLEREQLHQDAQRAFLALQEDLSQLQVHTAEYSVWDDTVAYIEGRKPDYEQVNLLVGTFTMARLDFVYVLDPGGRPVFSGAYTPDGEPAEPPSLLPLLRQVRRHPTVPEPELVSGLLEVDGRLALVCAHPAKASTNRGPPAGTLIFGRFLEAHTIARLARATRLQLSLWRPHEQPAYADLPALLAEPSDLSQVRVRDADTIASYVRLKTLDDAPAALLGVTAPRAIVQRGREAASFIAAAVGVAAALLAALTLLLVHLLVTRRLAWVDARVAAITRAPASGLRVGQAGADEIGRLAAGLDAMLDAVDELRHDLDHERAKSDRLLHNMLPGDLVARLRDRPDGLAERVDGVAVMFADLVGFTELGATVSAETLVGLLEHVFTRFDQLAEQHGVEKIKTIGDAYMAVCGVPRPHPAPTVALVGFALALVDALHEVNAQRGTRLSIRVGVHTGPVVAGVIGRSRLAYDLWGDTVNVASRMESTGVAGRVQVSDDAWRALGNAWRGTPRRVRAKGRGELVAWLIDGPQDGLPAPDIALEFLGEPFGTEEVPRQR